MGSFTLSQSQFLLQYISPYCLLRVLFATVSVAEAEAKSHPVSEMSLAAVMNLPKVVSLRRVGRKVMLNLEIQEDLVLDLQMVRNPQIGVSSKAGLVVNSKTASRQEIAKGLQGQMGLIQQKAREEHQEVCSSLPSIASPWLSWFPWWAEQSSLAVPLLSDVSIFDNGAKLSLARPFPSFLLYFNLMPMSALSSTPSSH